MRIKENNCPKSIRICELKAGSLFRPAMSSEIKIKAEFCPAVSDRLVGSPHDGWCAGVSLKTGGLSLYRPEFEVFVTDGQFTED